MLTSAGEPSHWIYPVLLKARKDPEHWRVSETPGPLPWVNLADLEAQGLRDSEFQMLHLNRWVQSEDRLVSAENLAAAAVLDGDQDPRPGISYRIGCDLGFVNDRSVVAVCHREPTGPEPNAESRVVVDNLKVWRGTRLRPVQLSEVEDWLVLVAKLYNNARIHCDPSEARGLLQRLQARGVRAEAFLFTTQSVGRLGQALHLALKSGLLWIPRDADLLEELGRVRLIPTGIGQARLDHDSGQHDDRGVAIGIATAILMEGSYGSGARQYLEALAPPCLKCGQPNAKGSTVCSACREPIAPVAEEPKPAVPWSPFGQRPPDRPPDRNTLATLELLRQYSESQQRGTVFNPYAPPGWRRY